MKKYVFLLFACCSLASLVSCSDDDAASGDTALFAVPVYRSLAQIRQSVSVENAQPTQSDGKIYVSKNRLFYIAQESGVHVFDNANPAQPQNIAFLNIEGVHDIAVKGNYLYADNFVDLLVFDISDVNNIQLVQTLENVVYFSPVYPTDAEFYDWTTLPAVDEIAVSFRTERRAKPEYTVYPMEFEGDNAGGVTSAPASGQVGVGGSYAKFQINGDALYTTENYSLKVFNIQNPEQTAFDKEVYLEFWLGGGQFETLFKSGDYLFVGATSGMYIVDATDAFNPVFLSGFAHATACDPVVVEGQTAYITVRGGSTCGAIEDQMNVIDISNVMQPVLVSSYLMDQPRGLGVRNNTVYVCAADGLRLYDASSSDSLHLMNTYTDAVSDVIPLPTHLVAVGTNVVRQYAYGPDFSLTPISTISF